MATHHNNAYVKLVRLAHTCTLMFLYPDTERTRTHIHSHTYLQVDAEQHQQALSRWQKEQSRNGSKRNGNGGRRNNNDGGSNSQLGGNLSPPVAPHPPDPLVSAHVFGTLVDGYMRNADAAAAEGAAQRMSQEVCVCVSAFVISVCVLGTFEAIVGHR